MTDQHTTGKDPLTALIEVLAPKVPATVPTDKLAEAAELLPGREATSVADLLDSPELADFRRAYAAGRIEARVIDQALGLLKTVLAARGWL